MEFKSPKWWKEFKALGRKHQAASDKQQAIDETVPHCDIEEAASNEELEGLKKYVREKKKPI